MYSFRMIKWVSKSNDSLKKWERDGYDTHELARPSGDDAHFRQVLKGDLLMLRGYTTFKSSLSHL